MLNTVTNKIGVVASSGNTEEYLYGINIGLNNEALGAGPTGMAIKNGRNVVSNNIETDDKMIPWRKSASDLGYRSLIALPIIVSSKTIGAFSLYSGEPGFFDEVEIKLLDEMAADISYALEFMESESERKRAEEALRESEKQVRRKLDAILSPDANVSALELADIIDSEKIQKLMDELFKVTHMGIGIIDLHGKVLVGTGWQEICTKFHRINPETRRLCMESDLELSRDVPVGTFKRYRCKNNMWDIASPIKLGDKHLGNIFLGQFLFDDETVDYETFRRQALQYGFNEEEYIAALDRVPRWSRKTVDAMMSFYSAFAEMIGNLGYANVKLAGALEDRKRVTVALETEKANLDAIFESSPVGMMILDATTNIVRANTAIAALSGCSRSDMLQHRPGNALRCIHSTKDPRGCGYAPACPLCPARRGMEGLLANGGTISGAEVPLQLVRNGEPQEVWLRIGAEPILMNGCRGWTVTRSAGGSRRMRGHVTSLSSSSASWRTSATR
jgi:ligand-binding sensor protein